MGRAGGNIYLGGITVIGTERVINITAQYSKRITVFVPDGVNAKDLIYDRVYEEALELPDSVEDFDYDYFNYKEV